MFVKKNTPAKTKAYSAVRNAKRKGNLVTKKTCQSCGSVRKLMAHHEDYNKPLEVMFLCQSCHANRHNALGWGVFGRPKLSWEYNFDILELFDFAIIKNTTIDRMSVLTNRFKRHTGRSIRCISIDGGIIVIRVK